MISVTQPSILLVPSTIETDLASEARKKNLNTLPVAQGQSDPTAKNTQQAFFNRIFLCANSCNNVCAKNVLTVGSWMIKKLFKHRFCGLTSFSFQSQHSYWTRRQFVKRRTGCIYCPLRNGILLGMKVRWTPHRGILICQNIDGMEILNDFTNRTSIIKRTFAAFHNTHTKHCLH